MNTISTLFLLVILPGIELLFKLHNNPTRTIYLLTYFYISYVSLLILINIYIPNYILNIGPFTLLHRTNDRNNLTF
jgi:hypothetical protein